MHQAASAIIIRKPNEKPDNREFRDVKRFLPAIALAAAACAAQPAAAREINRYDVGGWQIGVFTNDQSRRFSHCAASANYRNGLTLLFSVSESLEWAVGFSSPEWNLTPGRNFDIDIRIDGNQPLSVNGRAVNTKLLRATLADSAALFNQFRYGYRMVVRVNDNREAVFNLTNTNAMLTEILNCARKSKGYVDGPGGDDRPRQDDRNTQPRNSDPRIDERDTGRRSDNRTVPQQQQQTQTNGTGSSGSFSNQGSTRLANTPMPPRGRERDIDGPRSDRRPDPPLNVNAAPTPETRAEATRVASDILRRANFTFEFQKPEQLSGELQKRYDVVWRADEFQGSLRILPAARADTIEQVRKDVISADSAACKGKFDSGALPAVDTKSVTMFTSCKASEVSSTYYLILPRRQGGIYLLGILGSGDAAARVQNVAGAYRTVALEVVER